MILVPSWKKTKTCPHSPVGRGKFLKVLLPGLVQSEFRDVVVCWLRCGYWRLHFHPSRQCRVVTAWFYKLYIYIVFLWDASSFTLGIPFLPIQIFFELLTRVNSGCDLWERSWSGDANYAMKRQADFLAADSVVLSLCFLGTMTFPCSELRSHAGPCQVDPWWTHRLEESCSMQRTVASSSSSFAFLLLEKTDVEHWAVCISSWTDATLILRISCKSHERQH